MLRRKMLMFLATLVGLLLVAAIPAIWLLQGVLSDLDRADVTLEMQHHDLVWFRWVLLALVVVFLVVINVSVIMLLRMSNMVLQPMEQLVEASRRLGKEDFQCQVTVPPGDEFWELATAFNHMARQLQANEEKKLETLGQTSVMLNHELNNASAIIKLQLQLLQRQSTGSATFERCLRQIHESLSRMTATVEALKHVRRIVLTDYSGNTKMLDLERSVAEEPIKNKSVPRATDREMNIPVILSLKRA